MPPRILRLVHGGARFFQSCLAEELLLPQGRCPGVHTAAASGAGAAPNPPASGALMLTVARRDPKPAIEKVEWELLLFFGALFVVMRGLERFGAVGIISAEGTHAIELGGP